MTVSHALFVPPFGELAEPARVAELAATAENGGWDGLFLWDHVLRPPDETNDIADPWICMAAAAVATERIRLGPMVTPLVRRRPVKLAREVASLDRLSNGRFTLGIGLGVDTGGELSKFGEMVDARARGDMLDEGLPLLARLLEGDHVEHRGPAYTIDGMTLAPGPTQQPRPPIWLATRGHARRPVRRAARYDGIFPIEVGLDEVKQIVEHVAAERGHLDGFDVALNVSSLARRDDLPRWEDAGVTWCLTNLPSGVGFADAIEHARSGPRGFG